MNRSLLIMVAASQLFLSIASAQQQPPPSFLLERARRAGQSQSPDAGKKGIDWISSFMKDGFGSAGIGDERLWCSPNNPNCQQANQVQMPVTEGLKRYHYPSTVPMGTFTDLRMGMAPLNMLRTTRTGPTGLEYASLGLVEPILLESEAKSAQSTSNMESNLMHAIAAFVQTASANPETKEWVLQALNSCVSLLMETMPAVQAWSSCLYDRTTALPQGAQVLGGIGFKLSEHPDVAVPGQQQQGTTPLCLDDLAFNLSKDAASGAGAPIQVTPKAGGSCLGDLQTDPQFSNQVTGDLMRRYINSRVGCFCSYPNQNWAQQQQQGQQQTGDMGGARQLEFTFHPPPTPSSGRAVTKLQQDFYDNFVTVYNTLMKVVFNLCKHSTGTVSLATNPLASSQTTRRFWEPGAQILGGAQAPTPEDFKILSTEAFTVDPTLLESMFAFFTRGKLHEAHRVLTAADCNDLDPNGSTAQLDTLLQNSETAKDYQRFLFKYAVIIARLQYLGSLQVMQQFLTSVPANAWVRGKIYEHYVDKIVKAARVDPTDTRSLGQLIDASVEEMQQWRRDLYDYTQDRIGSGGKNVTGHEKSGNMGTSTDNSHSMHSN